MSDSLIEIYGNGVNTAMQQPPNKSIGDFIC